jgi:hypothetical protein
VLAAAAFLAGATASNAAIVTATYSGHMIFTAAEASGPPWGYDAYGDYIVGDAYSATIVFNTSRGTTVVYPDGEQDQDQRPGFATESFTVAGHTYLSAGSAISYYDRSTDSVEFNISYSPGDFGGQFFEALTSGPITPALDAPLSLTSPDFLAGTGGNVVVPGGAGGALFGDYDLEALDISASAPEPSTWAIMVVGLAGIGGALRSCKTAARRARFGLATA